MGVVAGAQREPLLLERAAAVAFQGELRSCRELRQ
jgi:hypothetical protein